MAKAKYPIIVSEVEGNTPKEKRYKIYCLAPELNAFNEVIDVNYTELGWPMGKYGWLVSKGSSGGRTPKQVALIAEGYKIAYDLTQGDKSRVSDPKLVKKFVKEYWDKKEKGIKGS